MRATSALFVLLVLFGCDVETDKGKADEINTTSIGGPSESLPMIDFPLLGEARPVDLIDMTLEFPESLKKLNGQRVSMVGFMAPFDSLEDMSRCQMVPSYVGCNFCSPPNLRQVVYVTQGSEDESEKTYSFIEEPSYVTGTFKISLPESDHEGKTRGFVYSIENATVVPFEGEAPQRAPGHTNPANHNTGQGGSSLSPVAPEELVREVCKIIGEDSLLSVGIEPVSSEVFGLRIRGMLEATYPQETRLARAQAFSLLGMLPQNFDLIEALTGFELAQRVAVFDQFKGQVLVLDSVPLDHPFVRLELVGAIADALVRKGASLSTGSKQNPPAGENNDQTRAAEALRLGVIKVVVQRYARIRGISTTVAPPDEFIPQGTRKPGTNLLSRWHSLPADVGPYFLDYWVGPSGRLGNLAMDRPPTTTIEFFRPLWHRDLTLWRRDPVPKDFAKSLTKVPAHFTDVLGAGGLMPFLASENSGYVVMQVSGQWAGDRWALWQFSDGSTGLLLETRWQDEKSALEFSNAIPQYPFQWYFPHEDGSSTVRLLRASSPAALNRLVPSNE